MNQADFLSGVRYWGTSNGPKNAWGLIPNLLMHTPAPPDDLSPVPFATIAPVVVTSYAIQNQAGATGIFLLFFDAAAVPMDTTALTDATGFVFAINLAAGAAFYWEVVHRYLKGLCVVASTSSTVVTRGNANTLFSCTYMSMSAG